MSLQKTPFKFRGKGGFTTSKEVRTWIRKGDFILSNLDDVNFQILPCSNAEFYSEAVARYVRQFRSKSDLPEVVIDHSPANVIMSHVLSKLFPNALFIHLIRDGRGVYSSVRKLQWGPSTPMAASKWWQSFIAPGLALESNLGESRVHRVYYEDLLTDTESTVRKICQFSGIHFDDRILNGDGVVLSPYARDVHKNIGKPPISSRIAAWRKDLPDTEKSYFTAANAAILANLGYESSEPMALPETALHTKIFWTLSEAIFSHFINRIRNVLRRSGSRMTISDLTRSKSV